MKADGAFERAKDPALDCGEGQPEHILALLGLATRLGLLRARTMIS